MGRKLWIWVKEEQGIGRARGRDVRQRDGGYGGTVEDVAGAGAKFKANAKRTKNRTISSAPFLTVPPPMALNRRWRWIGERDLAKAWGVLRRVAVMMCGFLTRGRSLHRGRGYPRLRPHRSRR